MPRPPLSPRAALGVLGASVLLAWFFWDAVALWPVKLLAVMVHEGGHALATLLVGGKVQRVTLAGDESGACLSLLPPGLWRQMIVYSAGYVGSALAGAALLVASFRMRSRRLLVGLCCGWLCVMGVFYAGDAFTLAFCLGTAVLLGLALRFLPALAVEALALFLAAFIALYAAFDLRSDLWDGAVRGRSDAALLASLTWVPALFWALLWSLASLALIGLALVHVFRAGTAARAVRISVAARRRPRARWAVRRSRAASGVP